MARWRTSKTMANPVAKSVIRPPAKRANGAKAKVRFPLYANFWFCQSLCKAEAKYHREKKGATFESNDTKKIREQTPTCVPLPSR